MSDVEINMHFTGEPKPTTGCAMRDSFGDNFDIHDGDLCFSVRTEGSIEPVNAVLLDQPASKLPSGWSMFFHICRNANEIREAIIDSEKPTNQQRNWAGIQIKNLRRKGWLA